VAAFAFEIYDFDGQSRLDLFYLGDILRSLKLNPTMKMVERFGGCNEKAVKFVDFDELCRIYSNMKISDELGTFEDFHEFLKESIL
jgi:Ca2+-binding EF-hand superfamily protein